MIFNGVNLSEYFKIRDIRKSLLPRITNVLKEIPGKAGSRYLKDKLQPLIISIDIEIKDKSKLEDKMNYIKTFLYTKDLKRLRILDKYYFAKLDGSTDLEKILYYRNTTLNFLCPDPIAYGETKTIDISSNTTIINQGSYKTTGRITIEVTQSIGHIQVTQQNTGEYVYIEHDFVAGDEVIIDLDREYVTKNGYSIMKDVYLESDFFDIPVGEFELTSSVPATLEYVERWL